MNSALESMRRFCPSPEQQNGQIGDLRMRNERFWKENRKAFEACGGFSLMKSLQVLESKLKRFSLIFRHVASSEIQGYL